MRYECATLLRALRCPVCGAPMELDRTRGAGMLFCAGRKKHTFDMSKYGYVHLLPGRSGSGDSREAVRARTTFLSAGYYEAAADHLESLLSCTLDGGLVVDAGCGEGYYTNQLGNAGYEMFGVDLSHDAVEAAARAAQRQGSGADFAVASLFHLPLADNSVDAIVNIFAPCAEQEFIRVLRPGGTLIVVGAGERHLLGLKRVLYDNPYENAGRSDLPSRMQSVGHQRLSYSVVVQGEESIAALFSMTPYYWRTSPADRSKLNGLRTLSTEVEFDFYIYRKP